MKMAPLAGLVFALALAGGLALYLARREARSAEGARAPVNAQAHSDSRPSEAPEPVAPDAARREPAATTTDGTRTEVAGSGTTPSIDAVPDDVVATIDFSGLLDLALEQTSDFEAKASGWSQRELKLNFDGLNAILTTQLEGNIPDGERELKPEQIETLQRVLGWMSSRIVH